jgi:hypothetical protein
LKSLPFHCPWFDLPCGDLKIKNNIKSYGYYSLWKGACLAIGGWIAAAMAIAP